MAMAILVAISFDDSIFMAATPHSSSFASHVHISTPVHSFSHGVGHVIPGSSRTYGGSKPRPHYNNIVSDGFKAPPIGHNERLGFQGYPRDQPAIPFQYGNSVHGPSSIYSHRSSPRYAQHNSIVLPPSPYQSNSPNPESLWPEGLFIPPSLPVKIIENNRQKSVHHISSKHDENFSSLNEIDPYYLEGVNALQAIAKIFAHGELYYDEIPHVKALLSNQQHRLDNGLQGNKLGSLRPSSPFYRLST